MKIEVIKDFLTVKKGIVIDMKIGYARELIREGLAKEFKKEVITKEFKKPIKTK